MVMLAAIVGQFGTFEFSSMSITAIIPAHYWLHGIIFLQ
jgi:hypothetical protein